MNPEVKESEYLDVSSPDFVADTKSSLVKANSETATSETTEQLRQIWERVYVFLAGLPEYLSDFFGEYKRPLITLGLIFGSVVSVKLTLAVLDAINDIPLLAPTFELIGFAYTAWFIYRYLWKATTRDELAQDFNGFKDQVLGKGAPKSKP